MADQPLVNFHFQVEWGGSKIGFSEVSGLGMKTEVLKYRNGASPEYHVIKMPGAIKYSNIVLKRGMMMGDNEFYDWWNTIQLNQVERRDITISLLNENHEPVVIWKVRNAFPAELNWEPLSSQNNAVFIEVLELAHEGIRAEAV